MATMRRLPRRPRGAPPAGCVHPSRWKAPRCDGIFPLARWALRRRVGDRTRSLSINQLVARRQGPSRNRRLMPPGFDHAANRGLLVQLCDDQMGGRFAQRAAVPVGMANGPNRRKAVRQTAVCISQSENSCGHAERKQRWLDCLDYFRDGRVAAVR
jgi:hypothetical protein